VVGFSLRAHYPLEIVARRPNNRDSNTDAGPGEDVVLFCGVTSDGRGVDVVRKRGSTLQAGVVRPLEQGKPIQGEVVELVQRGTTPLFDCTVRFDTQSTTQLAQSPKASESPATDEKATPAKALSDTRGHPARVATDVYRRNWDTIWKRSSGKALLN
jgi:hypothetical protein